MNICVDCKKACGGCSWSRADPVTKKLLFEPVPGWTAEPVICDTGKCRNPTYKITACPEFEPDDRVAAMYVASTSHQNGRCQWCGELLDPKSERKKFCEKCVPNGPDYQKIHNRVYRAIQKRGKT